MSANAGLEGAKEASPSTGRPSDPDALVLEAWAQGFMIGTLLFMVCVTIANMRRHVLLHKLILAELFLGMPHGTFIFLREPSYGWYLSATAIGLNLSWSLHNVIAWIKNKPFLSRKVSLFYIGTVILVQPFWVLEMYANFVYFNHNDRLYEKTRPYETLFRDPWWVYTTCSLFWVIKSQYNFGILELVRHSPRFGIMLSSMCLSIVFVILDIMSVVGVFEQSLPPGINPFWKMSYVLKCLCDMVVLDDFKTALDRLRDYWFMKNNMSGGSQAIRQPNFDHNLSNSQNRFELGPMPYTIGVIEPISSVARPVGQRQRNWDPPNPPSYSP